MASLFSLGARVVNFGITAQVVGHWVNAHGIDHDQDGWPILKAIGRDGRPRGGKWVADPSKCEAA
jgi:hypothetical protein